MGAKKVCCCLCCPCCFCLGTLRALSLLGAFVALLVALALGPAPLDLPDDVSDLCEAVAWFKDTELSYTLASTENLDKWVKGCRTAFLELKPEAQEILRKLRKDGRHRDEHVLRAVSIEERSRIWGNKSNQAIQRRDLKAEPRPPTIDISEIKQAFKTPKVAIFDATKFMPKHMFGASLESVAEMHPETINETILYGTWGGGGLCRMLLLMQVANAYPSLGRTLLFSAMRQVFMGVSQLCALKPVPWWLSHPEKRAELSTTNINVKRLPNFLAGLNVPASLGIEEDVAGMLGLLWMGQVPPEIANTSWHTDVQDNILVELTGGSWVSVVPRELFYGRPDEEQVSGTYYHVFLEPGTGIVIPSNYLHTVTHPYPSRFAVNFFFEPEFGRMQWPNSTGNFYVEEAKRRKEHLAMRALWFKSANTVFQRYGAGVSFHGWKMEVL